MAAKKYDLVINGGRVIDPETETDEALNLGISDGTITATASR